MAIAARWASPMLSVNKACPAWTTGPGTYQHQFGRMASRARSSIRWRETLNQTLTVVLPIHNAEATLRGSVDRVLEVAGELTSAVEVLIVDDGSTDDSFDIACEIASRFPQVQTMRQSQRRGLGPTLRDVRRRVKSDIVMVHDGVSSINAEQLRALWDHRVDPVRPEDVSASDLLRPKQNQAAMAVAHRRLMSFQMYSNDRPATANERTDGPAPAPLPRRVAPNQGAPAGAIPPLPAPNFLGAMSDFARGE